MGQKTNCEGGKTAEKGRDKTGGGKRNWERKGSGREERPEKRLASSRNMRLTASAARRKSSCKNTEKDEAERERTSARDNPRPLNEGSRRKKRKVEQT